MSDEGQSNANELLEVKLIAAAMHPGLIVVTPQKCAAVRKVLEEHLGPLLRAGQELYMEEWGGTVGDWIADSAPGRYVAALAALEGRDGK